jgi:hypothetical protein
MMNTEHDAILALNNFLMFENMAFLPLIGSTHQFIIEHNTQADSLVVQGYEGKTVFHRVNGAALSDYVGDNIFQDNVDNTQYMISIMEETRRDSDNYESYEQKMQALQQKLKHMYEKLDAHYWVVAQTDSEQALIQTLSFITTYHPLNFNYTKLVMENSHTEA